MSLLFAGDTDGALITIYAFALVSNRNKCLVDVDDDDDDVSPTAVFRVPAGTTFSSLVAAVQSEVLPRAVQKNRSLSSVSPSSSLGTGSRSTIAIAALRYYNAGRWEDMRDESSLRDAVNVAQLQGNSIHFEVWLSRVSASAHWTDGGYSRGRRTHDGSAVTIVTLGSLVQANRKGNKSGGLVESPAVVRAKQKGMRPLDEKQTSVAIVSRKTPPKLLETFLGVSLRDDAKDKCNERRQRKQRIADNLASRFVKS